ncbi:MAG: hypothetical protein ACRD0U_11380 [Acidimicrobiales bacterium]
MDSRAVTWVNKQGSVRAVGRWCAAVLLVGVVALIASAAGAFDPQRVHTTDIGSDPRPVDPVVRQDGVIAEGSAASPVVGGVQAPVTGLPSGSGEDGDIGAAGPPTTSPPRAEPRPTQPAPAPSVPTGPTHLAFGFNDAPAEIGWTTEQISRAMADMRPGAVFRFSVEWSGAQPDCAPSNDPLYCRTPQPFNWGPVDQVLSSLSAHGLRALPFLTSAPRWAWAPFEYSVRPEQRMPPRYDDTGRYWWQEFVKAFVAHTTSAFPGVLAGVEIWNEQNGSLFWTTSAGVSPARYKDLLCSAYAVSKAVAPNLPVVFGGTAFTKGTPGLADGELQIGEFVSGAYDAGARGCFDALSVHPHVLHVALAPNSPQNRYLEYIQEARDAAASHGDAGRTIWVTEVGYPTSPQQLDWDLMVYDMAAQQPDVGLFLLSRVFDSSTEFSPFGVCQRPGVPRPIASALKQRFTGTTAVATC